MIYGGVKFDKSVNETSVCRDAYDKDFNVARNCTTVAIPEFERFELTAYYLYRLTFGNSLNEVLYHNFPLTDIVLLYLPIYILTDFSQLYVFCLGHDEFNR
jgi:hypothetical protein